MTTMARPKKQDKEFTQAGWRVESTQKPLLDDLEEYARIHHLSRNSAITIAVERLIKEWKNSKSN